MGKWGPQCHTVVDVRAQWMGPFVRVCMCVCVCVCVCTRVHVFIFVS